MSNLTIVSLFSRRLTMKRTAREFASGTNASCRSLRTLQWPRGDTDRALANQTNARALSRNPDAPPPTSSAPKNGFAEPDQRDLGRPVPHQKIFLFPSDPNHLLIPRVPSHRGRLAIVTDAGRDAVDADGADNERH
jgi:hypothetical protein